MWNLIKQKLDIRGDHLNFNEFLRLLEAESYFRDIMFEYQLFYKSTKRLRYYKEVHLSNKRMGEYGEQIVKGVPQKLQAAHIIEKVLLFDAKGTTILVCAFENKNVHAVDYMTGDIIHEFVFKDESMPIAAPAPPKHQSVTAQPSPKKDLGKKIMRYQIQKAIMARENKQREIMSTLKAGFTKKLAETIQETINTDLKKEDSNRESLNKRKLAGKHRRVATQGRTSPSKEEPSSSMGLASPKPTAAKRSPRANTAGGPKARFFGILGLDAIQEEDGKLGGYKTVVSSQPNKGGKVVLKREYTYGLDERLYTSEYDRERNKRKFGDLMKKVDAEVKVNDAYLSEIKVAKKLRASGLSSLFRRKHEESESTLDTEIEAIIKKQDKRRQDENYQKQLEHFNLPDNEET